MEYLNSPRLMCQFASGELHFLVYLGYKSLGIDVGDRSYHPIIPNRSLEIFSCKKSDYSRRYHRYSICILTQYASFIQFQDKMKAKFSNDRFGIIEILLHFGNIAYPLLGKPLELGNINIAPVHGHPLSMLSKRVIMVESIM